MRCRSSRLSGVHDFGVFAEAFSRRLRALFESFSRRFRALLEPFSRRSRALFEPFSSPFSAVFEAFSRRFRDVLETSPLPLCAIRPCLYIREDRYCRSGFRQDARDMSTGKVIPGGAQDPILRYCLFIQAPLRRASLGALLHHTKANQGGKKKESRKRNRQNRRRA